MVHPQRWNEWWFAENDGFFFKRNLLSGKRASSLEVSRAGKNFRAACSSKKRSNQPLDTPPHTSGCPGLAPHSPKRSVRIRLWNVKRSRFAGVFFSKQPTKLPMDICFFFYFLFGSLFEAYISICVYCILFGWQQKRMVSMWKAHVRCAEEVVLKCGLCVCVCAIFAIFLMRFSSKSFESESVMWYDVLLDM